MRTRALVLGGGGVTGVAWELGVLAGLSDRGVDFGTADLIVGTSAGAVVGAQLWSGTPIAALYAAQLEPPGAEIPARLGSGWVARIAWSSVLSRSPESFRRRVGRTALALAEPTEAQRREVIAARLPSHEWPIGSLKITAVDAVSGEFVVFDRDTKVSLVDAVGASCAVPGVWPPVTIGGRRYMDGGMRSSTNADLAVGFGRIAVIAPITRGGGHIGRVTEEMRIVGQMGRPWLISPDAAAKAAIGGNVLDPARRAGAAQAGRAQGRDLAEQAAQFWK
ncbi:patatin-like phospholipase family protein [Hamadaea tsunoensis]|uniref:patatin-like phospholipase family protein n=1 Tax=Hamadaea tsunoensis TaxID=53368 RepID=UPI000551DBBE|nr:patatin-like phospholipase family protein [Hamadaea tsunoensis]